jgi:hypothetical protein
VNKNPVSDKSGREEIKKSPVSDGFSTDFYQTFNETPIPTIFNLLCKNKRK